MKKCDNCGKEYDDQIKFCSVCGSELTYINSQRKCPKCNRIAKEGEKFCEKCGTELDKSKTEINNNTAELNNKSAESDNITAESNNNNVKINKKTEKSNNNKIAFDNKTAELKNNNAESNKNTGEKDIVKKILSPKVLMPLSVFIIMIIGVLVFAKIKTNSLNSYITTYKDFEDKYDNLGKYEKQYKQYLEEANSIASGFAFWKVDAQKKKMQEICVDIVKLNKDIKEYKEKYDKILTEAESGKYFLGNNKSEFLQKKEEFLIALASFDSNECKLKLKEFENIWKRIIASNSDVTSNNDVAVLKKIITEQKKKGADVDENLYSKQYELTPDGKIVAIDWEDVDLVGAISFAGLTELEKLNCSSNQLTSLDISKNVSLVELECSMNQLTRLDVSNNVALEDLCCAGNQLTRLDVSKNIELWRLQCQENQLTRLDVSYNEKLCYLYCYENQITSLDLSYNSKIKRDGLECDEEVDVTGYYDYDYEDYGYDE